MVQHQAVMWIKGFLNIYSLASFGTILAFNAVLTYTSLRPCLHFLFESLYLKLCVMPTLLLSSLHEFKLFLQITSWIAIPATVLAIIITTIWHYRRKKKLKAAGALYEERFRLAVAGDTEQMPDWLASADPDNSNLLKKYEREIRRYKENYATLEQEFRTLEEKYADLLNKAYHQETVPDHGVAQLQEELSHYKEKVAQLQQALFDSGQESNGSGDGAQLHATIRHLQEALQQQQEQHAREIQQLEDLLHNMEKELAAAHSTQRDAADREQKMAALVAENDFLREQLQAGANGEEVAKSYTHQLEAWQQSLAQLREENNLLSEKLSEYQYMQDLLEEKQLQINFLQQQLDQRIRNYHQLEKQAHDTTVELIQVKQSAREYQQRVDELLDVLQEKQTTIGGMETELVASRELLQEKTQQVEKLSDELAVMQQEQEQLRTVVAEKEQMKVQLETMQQEQEALRTALEEKEESMVQLETMQQEQEQLRAVLAAKEQTIVQLETSLQSVQHHTKQLEARLANNARLLEKIITELSQCDLVQAPAREEEVA